MLEDNIKELAFELTILALQSFDFGGECSFEDAQAFLKSSYELISNKLDLELE